MTEGRGSHSSETESSRSSAAASRTSSRSDFEPHQHGLGLRVAEADVELEDLGALVREHQPGIEHASKRAPGSLQGVDGRDEDLALDLFHQVGRDDRGGREGAHAAGIGALVVVVGAFVILAGLQGDDRPAIGEGQDAGLLAVELLLDDEAVAGLAEDAPDHDLFDAVEGLAEVVADEDALAGGQAVGLEDQPKRPAQHEVAGLGGGAEDALLAAFFDLDLHARAEHLAGVHDPVDGLERLGGRAAMEGIADGRAAARADDQGDLARAA